MEKELLDLLKTVAGSTEIKRSDFGMKYGVPAVGDNIKLVFEIEAVRD